MPWTFCRVLYLNPAYHLKKRRQLVGRDTFLLYQTLINPYFIWESKATVSTCLECIKMMFTGQSWPWVDTLSSLPDPSV